jgi:hypothetical protein
VRCAACVQHRDATHLALPFSTASSAFFLLSAADEAAAAILGDSRRYGAVAAQTAPCGAEKSIHSTLLWGRCVHFRGLWRVCLRRKVAQTRVLGEGRHVLE